MKIVLETDSDVCPRSDPFPSDTKLKIYNYKAAATIFSYYLTKQDMEKKDICSYLKSKFKATDAIIWNNNMEFYFCNNASIKYTEKSRNAIEIYNSKIQQTCEAINDKNQCNNDDNCSWRIVNTGTKPCTIKERCELNGLDPLPPKHQNPHFSPDEAICKGFSKCNFNNTNKTCQYNQTHTVESGDECYKLIQKKCNLSDGFNYKDYICNKEVLDKCGSSLQIGDKIEYNCNQCNTDTNLSPN